MNRRYRDIFDADPAFSLQKHSPDPLPEITRWTPMRSCIRPITP
jgi:hypothetical protein